MNIITHDKFDQQELNEFVDYVLEFHGELTRDQVIQGLNFLIEDQKKFGPDMAYDGDFSCDSHDRCCIAEMWITGEFVPQEPIPNGAIMSETLPDGRVLSTKITYNETTGEKVFTKLS